MPTTTITTPSSADPAFAESGKI